MGLSAAGIGSGLDVESLISQMVTLQKSPLKALQTTASSLDTKISTYGKLKSLMSTLSDAATNLAKLETWKTTAATSSSTAVTVTVTDANALAGTSEVIVNTLARGHSQTSGLMAANVKFGAGNLALKVGGSSSSIDIPIDADSSMSDVVAAINKENTGVVASVMTNADGQQRLMLRSKETGANAAFTLTATGDTTLKALETGADGVVVQAAQNAKITVNGIEVESATNEFKNTLPGLNITVSQVAATPVNLSVKTDTEGLKKSLQAFMDAYNALNDALTSSTKYDAESKTAGTLQGDSTAVNMINSLRSVMSGTVSEIGGVNRLSELGILTAKGGKLSFGSSATEKANLEKALSNPESLSAVFASPGTEGQAGTQGLAVRMKELTKGMLDYEGTFDAKTNSLTTLKKSNEKSQERVVNQATSFEARMRAQYTALDTKMAGYSTLSAYMSQQVSQWNKS